MLAALGFHHYRSKIGAGLIGLSILPIGLPPLVLGIALISAFQVIQLTLSLATVAVGHLLLTIPVVLLTLYAAFTNFDDSLEEAAKDLGASPMRTFWAVHSRSSGHRSLALHFSSSLSRLTNSSSHSSPSVPKIQSLSPSGVRCEIGVSPSVNASRRSSLPGPSRWYSSRCG